jgi:methyl-accepting chemotaxis protein
VLGGKMLKKRLKGRRKISIKRKLIVFPLIVIFVGIVSIALISSWFIRKSLLGQMEEEGLALSRRVVHQIEDSTISLKTIDSMLEDRIRVAGKTVMRNRNNLSNDYLKSILKDVAVNELYWYNDKWEIIYSTVDDYIGWYPKEGHSLYDFKLSKETELMEKIRPDSESGNLVKYGSLKSADGYLVQVGIEANVVRALKDKFSYQYLAEELVKDKSTVYVCVVDTDKKVVAHSNKDRIGVNLEDENLIKAVDNQETQAFKYFYPVENKNVYNVIVPIRSEGEYIGSLNIGLSMDSIYTAINKNMRIIATTGIIIFIIFVLFFSNLSRDTIKTINKIKESLKYLESGDFSKEISSELLRKKDEFGEIANALSVMKEAIKTIISNIGDASRQVAASSQQLTSTSQQVSNTSNEVSKATEEISRGADDQAIQTENGARSVKVLGNSIEQNKQLVETLNIATKDVEDNKNEGIDTLNVLVEKTNETSKVTREVQEVISDTNKSAEKIENASQMIKNIADQTNLLALNAAIEAARAGEAGKGFAVVADEIRKLAEQSTSFTDEIEMVIKELADKTERAVAAIEEAGEMVAIQTRGVKDTKDKFEEIANSVERMNEVMLTLNSSSQNMEEQKNEIIDIIENLAAISEENAASTEEVAASIEEQTEAMVEVVDASEELTKLAERMQESILKFKY